MVALSIAKRCAHFIMSLHAPREHCQVLCTHVPALHAALDSFVSTATLAWEDAAGSEECGCMQAQQLRQGRRPVRLPGKGSLRQVSALLYCLLMFVSQAANTWAPPVYWQCIQPAPAGCPVWSLPVWRCFAVRSAVQCLHLRAHASMSVDANCYHGPGNAAG